MILSDFKPVNLISQPTIYPKAVASLARFPFAPFTAALAVTTTFKKMLETPMTQMQNPTLISISKVHATSVCVQKLGSCSEAQLEPGMVDVPMANQQNRPVRLSTFCCT